MFPLFSLLTLEAALPSDCGASTSFVVKILVGV
jgi:hypothetical protein